MKTYKYSVRPECKKLKAQGNSKVYNMATVTQAELVEVYKLGLGWVIREEEADESKPTKSRKSGSRVSSE